MVQPIGQPLETGEREKSDHSVRAPERNEV